MNKTYDDYYVSVIKDGMTLKDVPTDIMDEDIIVCAVEQNVMAFQYIPKDKMNFGILLHCLGLDLLYGDQLDEFIKLLSLDSITYEMYKQILAVNKLILKYIPISTLTNELILASIDPYNRSSLKYVPNDMFTDELCLQLVKCNGKALKYVPLNKRTNDIILKAVYNNGYALKYITPEQMTEEIISTAVKSRGLLLQYVPKEKQTSKICRKAVLNDIDAMNHIKIMPNDNDLEIIGNHVYTVQCNRFKYHALGHKAYVTSCPFGRLR